MLRGVGSGLLVFGMAAGAFGACSTISIQRLDEQVAFFHDDLRWGRMPAAEQSVAASRRNDFVRRHASWGRAIQIVDMETEATRVTGTVGVVVTRYSWMRGTDMLVRSTLVESRWHGAPGGSWVMNEERVLAGDPLLLAVASDAASSSGSAREP